MCYATDDQKYDYIWNSRDGVTPFIILNRDGTKEMRHIFWEYDKYLPDFVPPIGSRIFIDMTRKKLLEYKRAQVEKAWDDPKMPMKAHPYFHELTKEQAARRLAEDLWKEGMPDLVIVDKALYESFRERSYGPANCFEFRDQRRPVRYG